MARTKKRSQPDPRGVVKRGLHLLVLAIVAACAPGSAPKSDKAPVPRPALKFQKASGCGNVFLYAASADGREFIVVSLDQRRPELSEEETVLDVARLPRILDVHVDLFERPPVEPYCTDIDDGLDRGPIHVWRATSGQVSITVGPHLLDARGRTTERFRAKVRLERCRFEFPGEAAVDQVDPIEIEAEVGWSPG